MLAEREPTWDCPIASGSISSLIGPPALVLGVERGRNCAEVLAWVAVLEDARCWLLARIHPSETGFYGAFLRVEIQVAPLDRQ